MTRNGVRHVAWVWAGIFLVSGISGLIYQVIWVREFARIFGNTIHSAALVTSVFMGGLGLGSFVVGRWIDRRYAQDGSHPLRAYALSELAIGMLGLVFAVLLPRLTALSASASGYQLGEHGFHELSTSAHAVRYVVAILAVAPATFLMGGTLTLVIRAFVGRELGDVGARIGILYGVNTLGAAFGALATDFWLVPALGLFNTQCVAIALNVIAGAAALATARHGAGTPPIPDEEALSGSLDVAPATTPDRADDAPAQGLRPVVMIGVATLLSGFAAMGFEMVWFRYLAQLLGELRGVFSLLLAVILVGIWLGSTISGWVLRRVGRPLLLFVLTQALFALSTSVLLGFCDHAALASQLTESLREPFLSATPAHRALLELWFNLRAIALLVLIPAFFMGATFPLANAAAQDAVTSIAGRAGLLYLANTAGNVLGSGLVGFVLLPLLGIQTTALLLLVFSAASAIVLAIAALPKRWLHRSSLTATSQVPLEVLCYVAAFGTLAVAVGGFAMLPKGTLLRPSLVGTEGGAQSTLSVSEGLNETIVVATVPGYQTRLLTNGHAMSGDSPAARRYMHSFAHLPLLFQPAPTSALVICFGTGNTLYAASLHPSMSHLEIVDLSRHVLENAPYFRATSHDVLTDPRVEVFVNDGRNHLLMKAAGSYDLITLEPPPIAFAGVSSLYTKELYTLARSRLRPGGYMSQWLPAYQLGGAAVLSMVRAFIDVFPESALVSGDADELILIGTTAPTIAIDPAVIQRRIEERPAVMRDLASFDIASASDIAAMFAGSYATMRSATADIRALEDDRPSIEYVRLSRLGTLAAEKVPGSLFDVTTIGAFCPDCPGSSPDLGPMLRLEGRVYASEWFLSRRAQGTSPPHDPEGDALVARSPYLQRLYGGESVAARQVALRLLDDGDVDDAIATLRHAVFSNGTDAETYEALGLASLAAQDFPQAADALSRSLGADENRPSAHFAFARALEQLGYRQQAMDELHIGLKQDPDNADGHFDLARMLAATQKAASIAELETTLALDPLHPRANLTLCRRMAMAGHLPQARALCEVAVRGGVALPPEIEKSVRSTRAVSRQRQSGLR